MFFFSCWENKTWVVRASSSRQIKILNWHPRLSITNSKMELNPIYVGHKQQQDIIKLKIPFGRSETQTRRKILIWIFAPPPRKLCPTPLGNFEMNKIKMMKTSSANCHSNLYGENSWEEGRWTLSDFYAFFLANRQWFQSIWSSWFEIVERVLLIE